MEFLCLFDFFGVLLRKGGGKIRKDSCYEFNYEWYCYPSLRVEWKIECMKI